MKRFQHSFLSILLITVTLFSSEAQTIIRGTVRNDKKEPVASATVRIKFSASTTATDSLGAFVLPTTKKGAAILMISSVGYGTKEIDIDIADSNAAISVVLQPEVKAMGEVVVVGAGTFEASDKAKGASLTPIDAVTVAGNGGDIANSLRALPGTQQVGEKEGLFVRGGTNDEAKQFVDGTLIQNPNYSSVPGVLQPARLNPFLFKGILFSTGGYSALYGQAMSSALILETVDLPDVSSVGLGIFPMVSFAGFQQLSKNKRSSYGVNANFGNSQFYNKMIGVTQDFFHGPQYISANANFRIRTGKTGMLKFYTNYGYDRTGVRNPDPDSSGLLSSYEGRGSNLYNNLSYRNTIGKGWKLDAGIAYSYYDQKFSNRLLDLNKKQLYLSEYPFDQKNNDYATQRDFAQARTVFTKNFRRRQALRIGAEYFFSDDRFTRNDTISAVRDNLVAAFTETDIYIAKDIAAKIGLRSEYSTAIGKAVVAPRLSLAYRIPRGGQINMAYGVFYQKPESIYLLTDKTPDFSNAQHFILNYQHNAGNRWIRLEAYYKIYKKLVTSIPYIANGGDGYARGFELFYRDKKTFRDFDYWISYTYLDTKRKFLDYPYTVRPSFSTPHTASIVIKRFFTDLSLNINMSYSFATGRPYYFIRNTNGSPLIADHGTTRTYSNMNLSFAYLFTMFPKWKHKDFSGIGWGVNNVFGRTQVFGYNYGVSGASRVPVTLPAARTFYFGFFTGFGTDRRDDIINDNL
jgi:vitamin B12 transporter